MYASILPSQALAVFAAPSKMCVVCRCHDVRTFSTIHIIYFMILTICDIVPNRRRMAFTELEILWMKGEVHSKRDLALLLTRKKKKEKNIKLNFLLESHANIYCALAWRSHQQFRFSLDQLYVRPFFI